METKKVVSMILVALVALNVVSFIALKPCAADTYEVEIVTADTGRYFYDAWWHMGEFAKTAYMQAKVTLRNNCNVSKDVRVTCTLMDNLLTPVGYTEKSVTVPASATQDVFLDPLQVADYAFVGQAKACICAIKPNGAPYCPEYDVIFTILGNAYYNLTVEAYITNGTQLTNAWTYVDGVQYTSTPVTVSVLQGIHIVKAEPCMNPYWGDYHFLYWEDQSTANPRSVTVHVAKTVRAYYNYYVEIVSADTGRFFYDVWWHMGEFAKTAYMQSKATLKNNALTAKEVRVTCSLLDNLSTPVGYTEKWVTIPASTTQDVILDPLQVASYAVTGQARACICAVDPSGAPYCAGRYVPFTILGSTYYSLAVQAFLTNGTQISNAWMCVDGVQYTSTPFTLSVLQGIHVIKAEPCMNPYFGDYHFLYWEDKSTANPRSVTVHAAITVKAYFDYYVVIQSAQIGRNFFGYWWTMTKFAKTAYMEDKVILKNNALVSKNVKVAATIIDCLSTPCGYTEKNVTISANSTQTVYLGPVQIADYAFVGTGAYVHIVALTPEGAPYCPAYNVNFEILGPTSYGLTIRSYLIGETEIMNVAVYVDGGSAQYTPVTVTVLQGSHVAKATIVFYDEDYRYRFSRWEDYSTANPRQLDVYSTKTIKAYYTRTVYPPPGCPILSVFNGTEYVEEGLLNIHQPEGKDVITEDTLVIKPQAVGNFYLFRLQEHPLTHSYIDQVKLYAVLRDGRKIWLPLVSAVHSVHGNVKHQLLFSDDIRIDTEANESIYLKFVALPHLDIQYFTFIIEGHNMIPKPT